MCKKIYSIMGRREKQEQIENTNFSRKVLTIGCKYNPPKGGIAQVLFNYKRFIYDPFFL